MSTQGMRLYLCSAKRSRFQGTGLRPHQGKRTIRGQERKERWMRKGSDSCCWPEDAKLQPSSQVQRKMGLQMQDKRRGTQSRKGSGQGRLYFWTSKKAADCHRNFISYLQAWADELVQQGFRPGVYCSGIPVNDGNGLKIVTAENIRSNEQARDIVFWVFNDVCPPSPGCRTSVGLLRPAQSGVEYAVVWQFVRSPRPKETAFACGGYANDGNCYAAADAAHRWHLDLDLARSSNPSASR